MTTRILTGVALLALLVFAVVMGGWVFSVLFMASICICVYEVYRAMRNAGRHPVEWPVWLCVFISIPAFLVTRHVWLIILLMGCACVLTCTNIIFQKEPSLDDMMVSCLPMFSVLLPGMCMLSFQQFADRNLQTYFIIMSPVNAIGLGR